MEILLNYVLPRFTVSWCKQSDASHRKTVTVQEEVGDPCGYRVLKIRALQKSWSQIHAGVLFFLLQQKERHHVRYQGHSHMTWRNYLSFSKPHPVMDVMTCTPTNNLCVCVCTCVYVYVCIFYIIIYMMCVRKRAHQLPWNWSSRLLWATWLGSWAENWTKCSGRTAGSFNYWAISLAFLWAFKEQKNNKMCTGQSCYFFRPHMVPRWQSPSQSKTSPLLPQPSMQNSVLLLVIMPTFFPYRQGSC